MNRNIICAVAIALCFYFTGKAHKVKKQDNVKLRFAYMTDVHLKYNNVGNCFAGFQQALDTAQKRNVEFIVFGGDCLDMNEYGTSLERADSLYVSFKSFLDKTPVKTYPAIGNHDRFFNNEKGYNEGDELFKKYFKESYYTFEHKGIRFFVLNSVQAGESGSAGYHVGTQQMKWLHDCLQTVSPETPIVAVTHVPVYSISEGGFTNGKELLKAFENHNLKLVLQGHIHLYEEIYSQKIWYVSAGAVSSGWWEGTYQGTEEGFLVVDIDSENNFKWNYVDFGWVVKEPRFK
ncbi:MAG: metallophosphoesterase [Prevotellaceae bacterium]|jgi:DNA repair exonuclease SbcCD nuclease subunit|nr:metallophosphoesterase [Prevotellaceae bacterium]